MRYGTGPNHLSNYVSSIFHVVKEISISDVLTNGITHWRDNVIVNVAILAGTKSSSLGYMSTGDRV